MDSIVSLRDGDLVTPAAGLLTLFLEPKSRRAFQTRTFRRLVQMLAAQILNEPPEIDPATGEWVEASYRVATQQLGNLFDRWRERRWLRARELRGRSRNKKVYEVTPLGAAELMTLICRSEEALRANHADRLLSALFVVDAFPLEMIRRQMPEIDQYLGTDDRIGAADWRVTSMKERWDIALAARITELHEMTGVIQPITTTVATHAPHLKGLDLAAAARQVTVKGSGRHVRYFYGTPPREVPLPKEADVYLPSLFPYRRQRDRRLSHEVGLEPLLNLYREFQHDFVAWHLFEGIGQIRRLYLGWIDSLQATRKLIATWKT
jgi:hypothetical protein